MRNDAFNRSLLLLGVLCSVGTAFRPGEAGEKLDPAAWGGDHVGKPLPQFPSGDECLFCHRADVAPTWAANRHNLSIREIEASSPALAELRKSPELAPLAAETKFVLGRDRQQRFLKPAAEYGKLDLLSAAWTPSRSGQEAKLHSAESPRWDRVQFGASCAGCHATGVDSKQLTFTALSLDCFACHGEMPDKHTTDSSLAFLSKKRSEPDRVVVSVCGQCHLRTGKSQSSGLPYPNNFVAGDNLFRDFQVDLSDAAIQRANPADGHVLTNVRDVAILGQDKVTCLSCHSVHASSTTKHHRVAAGQICLHCHYPDGPKKARKPYEVHSRTCGY